LTQPISPGIIPLHYAAINIPSIEAFRAVFKSRIPFFIKKKGIGILFRKTYCGTPIQTACYSYGRDQVVEVTESTLSNCMHFYHRQSMKVYIRLRIDFATRDPDMLHKLLSSATPFVSINDNINNTERGNIDKNDYDDDEYYNLKKRKLTENEEDEDDENIKKKCKKNLPN
jgi:hypothetical protein